VGSIVASRRILLIALALLSAIAAHERAAAAEFELLPPVTPRANAARLVSAPAPGPRAFCVRLCDGYLFPIPSASGPLAAGGEEANCRALCPAARVALYHLLGAADEIGDATSASGERYAALPTAFRYRAATPLACACRRAGAAGLDYWRDPTLRNGDAVMTNEGVVIFHGAGGGAPYSRADFAPLDAAPIGSLQRADLSALRPASPPQSADDESPASKPAPGRGIEEARRAGGASAASEIRFLAAPSGGGG
jgi:hypothetical protein